MPNSTFQNILEKYRKYSFSEHDKGDKFERLMAAYLQRFRKKSRVLRKPNSLILIVFKETNFNVYIKPKQLKKRGFPLFWRCLKW